MPIVTHVKLSKSSDAYRYTHMCGYGCNRFVGGITVIVMLLTMILLMVISGMGYQYFKDDIIVGNCYVNMKVMFGCGIGMALFSFLSFWCFMSGPTLCPLIFMVWVPIILACSLFIAYTNPSYVEDYVSYIGYEWMSSTSELQSTLMTIQFQHECCGWSNFTDRAIPACPMDFASGCESKAREYLTPRMSELFGSSIGVLVVSIIAGFILVPVAVQEDTDYYTVMSDLFF